MFLNYLYIVIITLYGLLSILAGGMQYNNPNKRIKYIGLFGLIIGGLLLLSSNLRLIYASPMFIIPLILGLFILHIIAIYNSKAMYGKLNFKHHFIRFLISMWLVMLYMITSKI